MTRKARILIRAMCVATVAGLLFGFLPAGAATTTTTTTYAPSGTAGCQLDASLGGQVIIEDTLNGCTFSAANLDGVSVEDDAFNNTTWNNLEATNAKFVDSSFLEAVFNGGDLSNSWLLGGTYTGATFTGTNFSGVNFQYTNLTGAHLVSVNLAGAQLGQATFTSIVSSGIVGVPASLPTGWQIINGVLVQSNIIGQAPTSRSVIVRAESTIFGDGAAISSSFLGAQRCFTRHGAQPTGSSVYSLGFVVASKELVSPLVAGDELRVRIGNRAGAHVEHLFAVQGDSCYEYSADASGWFDFMVPAAHRDGLQLGNGEFIAGRLYLTSSAAMPPHSVIEAESMNAVWTGYPAAVPVPPAIDGNPSTLLCFAADGLATFSTVAQAIISGAAALFADTPVGPLANAESAALTVEDDALDPTDSPVGIDVKWKDAKDAATAFSQLSAKAAVGGYTVKTLSATEVEMTLLKSPSSADVVTWAYSIMNQATGYYKENKRVGC